MFLDVHKNQGPGNPASVPYFSACRIQSRIDLWKGYSALDTAWNETAPRSCRCLSRSVTQCPGAFRDTVMHVSIVTGWPLEKGQFIWKRKKTTRSHTILTGDIHRSTADDKIRLCWPFIYASVEVGSYLAAVVSSCYLCLTPALSASSWSSRASLSSLCMYTRSANCH